ncbi:MAG: hypothetical protein NTY80_00125 [candidate division SR1 bacterium]|nr:hypothetical protein [candidate division SR1 bacterium]
MVEFKLDKVYSKEEQKNFDEMMLDKTTKKEIFNQKNWIKDVWRDHLSKELEESSLKPNMIDLGKAIFEKPDSEAYKLLEAYCIRAGRDINATKKSLDRGNPDTFLLNALLQAGAVQCCGKAEVLRNLEKYVEGGKAMLSKAVDADLRGNTMAALMAIYDDKKASGKLTVEDFAGGIPSANYICSMIEDIRTSGTTLPLTDIDKKEIELSKKQVEQDKTGAKEVKSITKTPEIIKGMTKEALAKMTPEELEKVGLIDDGKNYFPIKGYRWIDSKDDSYDVKRVDMKSVKKERLDTFEEDKLTEVHLKRDSKDGEYSALNGYIRVNDKEGNYEVKEDKDKKLSGSDLDAGYSGYGKYEYTDTSTVNDVSKSWNYEGTRVNGHMAGTGKWSNANGTYIGNFEYSAFDGNSAFDGKGEMLYTDGSKVDGEFKEGKIFNAKKVDKNGRFLLEYIDGVEIDKNKIIDQKEYMNRSEFKFTGYGKLVFINDKYPSANWTYEGMWKEGKITGEGKWTSPEGRTYTGSFVDKKFEGKGKEIYKDGTKLEGEWKDDELYNGKETDKNGKIVGEYIDGVEIDRKKILTEYTDFTGYGKYIDPDGTFSYEGMWRKGKLEGQGTYIDKDKTKSIGEWKDDSFISGKEFDKNGKLLAEYENGVKK